MALADLSETICKIKTERISIFTYTFETVTNDAPVGECQQQSLTYALPGQLWVDMQVMYEIIRLPN